MGLSGVRFPGFLILCIAVVLAPLAAVDVNALYSAAETALYDDGDYELAIEKTGVLIENLESINPAYHATIYNMRALAFGVLEQWEEARQAIEEAIERTEAGSSIPVNYYLVHMECCSKTGSYERAATSYRNAVILDPHDIDIYRYAYWMYHDNNQMDAARSVLAEGIRYNPDERVLYQLQAFFHEGVGEYAAAAEDYTRLADIDSDNSIYYRTDRAYCYYEIGEYEAALDDMNYALDNGINVIGWDYELRGDIYTELGDVDLAIADYEQASELNEENGSVDYDLLAKLARGYLEVERYSDAIDTFTEALLGEGYMSAHMDSLHADYRDVGYAYAMLGYLDTALGYYNLAIMYNEYNNRYYLERGDLYVLIGDGEAALEDYNTCFDLQELPSVEDIRRRGSLLYRMGDWDGALADFKAITGRTPYDPVAWSDLARVYQAAGNHTAAIEAFSRNLSMRFADEYYWTEEMYLRAYSLAVTGDFKAALEDLELLISLDESAFRPIHLKAEIHEASGDIAAAVAAYRHLHDVLIGYYGDDEVLMQDAEAVLEKINTLKSQL